MAFNGKSLNLFKNLPDSHNVVRQAVDMARTRVLVASACVLLAFVAVSVRLVMVGCFQEGGDGYMLRDGDSIGLHTGRATFVDRNGQVLASTIRTASLFANTKKLLNPKEAATKLRKVFPKLKHDELLKKLTSGKSFIWIERHLTPQQKSAVIGLGIPGLSFMTDTKRVYPYGPLLSHAVGFVDVDNNGISGLEKGLDEQLRSSNDPVVLSLDIRLQHVLYDELKKGIETFSANGASGMIMDITTGEIMAMVSLPDFDPNKPGKMTPEALFNSNTLGVYEMGSTMKILNTAMLLDSGKGTLTTKYDATKPLKVGRFFVTDYHAKNTWLDVSEIFVYSSNIGSAKMALEVGSEGQKKFMEKVGMLTTPEIEIPEIGAPISPGKWREANTITISYGYGLSVSPLQFSLAVAGVVNEGNMPQKATFIKQSHDNVTLKKVMDKEKSAQVLHLMRETVEKGTGRKAAVPGIVVAGKTGTTNHRKAQGRGYQKKEVNTSFVGVFPEKPRYVVFVMLDGPKGKKFTFGFNAAGWNAAPVAGHVIKRVAPILGVYPEYNRDKTSVKPFIRQLSY